MCGRYALICAPETMAEFFGVDDPPQGVPRYNIAPSQAVPMIRDAADGRREWFSPRWGLIPSWAKEPKTGFSTINARAETVAEKPAFRTAFKYRRGLIPASGYFEWALIPGSKTKQPYFIHPADAPLFAFAGLWERWGVGEAMIESCTIIVTAANERTRPIHERMPCILAPEDYEAWLRPALRPASALLPLLKPCPPEWIAFHRVGTGVNNPRNDRPDLIRALPELF